MSVGKILDTIQTDHAVFQFTRSGDTALPLTVTFSLGGSATEGSDYDTVAHSVTIEAGYAATMIGLPTKADNLVENTETIPATIEPVNYVVSGSTASANILDDPARVWIDATPSTRASTGREHRHPSPRR